MTKLITPKSLAAAKLASSGLTLADAKSLDIEILTAAKTNALFQRHNVPAIKFWYHDKHGKRRKQLYRIRLLKTSVGAFGQEDPTRYLQPAKSVPGAYLPRSVPWDQIAVDTDVTVVITEGELKAAAACKHGHACIGLGGVYSFRSAKLGWSLLPELAEFVWLHRDVVICYDADAVDNPQVARATVVLARLLSDKGARPRIATLPKIPGVKKVGLDDYIMHEGSDALSTVLSVAPGDDLTYKLWEFNSRFAFILDPGLVYDEEKHQRHNAGDFRTTLYANVWATEIDHSDDTPKLKPVQVAPRWIKWPHRRQLDAMTYAPGAPILHRHKLNCWRGWGCKPAKGSVEPWRDLLDHLFRGADPSHKQWFERWCGYPFKHPGTKLINAVGIWSREQGQGKSLVGETLGRLYGENYIAISQRELESDFNGWAVNKQFIMVDDVSSHDSRSKADILKKLITQTEMIVNVKFVPTYTIPDCAAYYLTSNRANAFYIEDHDRRFFIHEVLQPKRALKFYQHYHAWLSNGGAPALFHYFKSQLKYGDWSPHVPPPLTESKREMVRAVKTELGGWLSEMVEYPDQKLKFDGVHLERDLYTAKELIALFDRERIGKPVTPNIMGLYLKDYCAALGIIRVGGMVGRYYAVRNQERWREANTRERTSHIKQHVKKEEKRGGYKF